MGKKGKKGKEGGRYDDARDTMALIEQIAGLIMRVVISVVFAVFWFYTWYVALGVARSGKEINAGILALMNGGVAWGGKYLFAYLFDRSRRPEQTPAP